MREDPGTSVAVMARLLLGWVLVALGLLNLAMGLVDVRYVLFHAVLVAGGALLLAWGKTGRAVRPIAVGAGGVTAVAGLVISAVPQVAACCFRDLAVRHGFPFTVAARDPGGWRFSGWHLVADLVFWALIGLLVMALIPGRRRSGPAAGPVHHTHAEPRAAEVAAPDDENVGGLP